MKRIDRIVIEKITDQFASTSTLGEYSDTPGANAIDRKKRGDMGHGEYRYFNPAMSVADAGSKKYLLEDYKRAEAFNRGEWEYVGVRAVAYISTAKLPNGPWKRHKIASAGLWGIESFSDASYFGEIAGEELSNLTDELQEFGFTADEIKAVKVDPIVEHGPISAAEQFSMSDE